MSGSRLSCSLVGGGLTVHLPSWGSRSLSIRLFKHEYIVTLIQPPMHPVSAKKARLFSLSLILHTKTQGHIFKSALWPD
jgi:hypothetical protein